MPRRPEARQAKPEQHSSQAMMQLSTAQQTLQIPDVKSGDLYAYNSLHSFSFGSAQPQQPPPRSVHPLSPVHGDEDSIGEDLRLGQFDLTPRPSVVTHEQNNQCGHVAQQASHTDLLLDGNRTHEYGATAVDLDAGLHSGPSIASTSVTSLSSSVAGGDDLRSGSRASHNSSCTNQTSAEQSVIDDDDDRHPHTINPTSHGADSSRTSNLTVEFSSDDEYGDSEYDCDYCDEEGVSIEIGSAQYEGSIATNEGDHNFHVDIGNGSGSIWNGSSYMERRGSAVMSGTPVDDSLIFAPGRNREGSLATLRRPSRSLDGDFVNLGLTRPTPSNPLTMGYQLEPSPTSVPGTGGDWRLLEERNKDREISRSLEIPASPPGSKGPLSHISKLPLNQAVPASDFDLDWAQMQRGITGLDPSAMGDIVGSSSPPGSGNRRLSATGEVGAKWLLSWTREARRPSAATVSSYGGDTFGKAIRDWDGPSYQAQRRDWSFKKENRDVSLPGEKFAGNILPPKGSMAAEKGMPGHAERDTDREKRSSSAVWKGMPLNTYEYWSNDRLGRFRIERRARKGTPHGLSSMKYAHLLSSATNENKSPQQRLSIQPVKSPYGSGVPSDGPPVTIHKHSKAVAFSISRYYRLSRKSSDTLPTSSRTIDATPHMPMGGLSPASKRGSSMILLAPRRVQEAYTSTTTTRKLESHGLLDDPAASRSQNTRDKESHRWQKEREKEQTQKEKKEKVRNKRSFNTEEAKGKGQVMQQVKDDSHVHSTSSTFVQPLPPSPASAPSIHTYPPSTASLSNAMTDREACTPEHPNSRNSSRHSRRRRRVRDPLEENDDDDDEDDESAPPTRTPHSEAFGTMDAALIEQLRQDRFNGDSEKGGLWNRLVGRGTHGATASTAQLHAPFVAPWLALQPRNKQESHQVVIDTLNDSFKDVGLLPSNYSASRHTVPTSQRQKKIAGSHNNNDPFKQIPEDALYMLLPLWPGDTDMKSETLSASSQRPFMHNHRRQYLLVYYKPPPEEEHKKTDRDNKKRLRSSPTSSYDPIARREERASVLLASFHITARLVPYQKLQGTGVRVPDEGLTVTGPLETAFVHMPPLVDVDENYYEYVLGICHSRDAGIEFYPDGLVKMGLCEQSQVPLPVSTSEEDTIPEPEVKLTPIGRAVLEMIWSGALALTSFGASA
ncbi:hypothetical protein C0992_009373 [Termitomyces sp. T32_za158]|nr:hypothetical protein C0992_009373 [Termitomyces sp. T32_za158]